MSVIVWVLNLQGGLRGLDYLIGEDERSPQLLYIETAFPLWFWGSLFLGAALILSFGMLTKRHALVWLGHWLFAASYALLCFGMLIGTMSVEWWDGWRGATTLFVTFLAHFLLWLRTGYHPLNTSSLAPTEMTGAPSDVAADDRR